MPQSDNDQFASRRRNEEPPVTTAIDFQSRKDSAKNAF